MMMFKFEVGQKVKDRITGFQGIIIARTEWLNGCLRYVVQAQKRTAEGKTVDDTIDEQQLILMEKPKEAKKKGIGGAYPTPKMMATPKKY